MFRKRIALVLTGILCCMSLNACGNSIENDAAKEQTDTNLTDGKVSLTVLCDESGTPLMEKIIESFKQEYAGQADFDISIIQADESGTRNVILDDVNHAPDVFIMPDDQLNSMVSAGVLSPVPEADDVKKENVAGSIEAASYQGQLYAYPLTADNGYFMYYNKNYFAQSDVESLERMLEVAEENDKKITMDLTLGWYLFSFFGNTGLEMRLNGDGITNYCNWNTTEGEIKGIDVGQTILEISQRPGFVNGGDAALVPETPDDSVIAGVSGVWQANKLRELWGEGYAAVKLPTYTVAGKQIQMASFTGYKLVGVNYYSKESDWAHKFAKWITNEQNQTLRFEYTRQGPSNIKAGESDIIKQEPAICAVINQSQYGVLQRVGNYYWDACSQFGNTMIEGNTAGTPMQDIMDKLAEGISTSVAK